MKKIKVEFGAERSNILILPSPTVAFERGKILIGIVLPFFFIGFEFSKKK